jgi:hypothetical protein
MIGFGGYFRTWKTRRRFAKTERDWDRSDRKREIEAECELPPRPLSEDEEKLLRRLLEQSEAAKSFLPQLRGMKATRSCTCGCPSITLFPETDGPFGQGNAEKILSDQTGYTEDGKLVGLMVFQGGGRLFGLEVYSLDGEGGPLEFGLPVPDSPRDFHAGIQLESTTEK